MFIRILFAFGLILGFVEESRAYEYSRHDEQFIAIKETGVARRHEGQMRLFCKDEYWLFSWKSSENNEISDVEIIYFSNETSAVLSKSSRELERKVNFINSVSATCNYDDEKDRVSSSLLINAYDISEGTPVSVRISLNDGGLGDEIYITEIE